MHNPALSRTALLLCVAAALAGCQAFERLTGPTGPTQPAAVAPAAAPPQDPAPGGEPEEQAALSVPVDDDPKQFLGQEGEAISATLGAPDLVRRDGPAEVRQFRGGACTLDLFLYPGAGDVLSVRHVELRGASLDGDGRRACLADMIRTRTLSG